MSLVSGSSRSKIYPINQSRNPLQALYKAKFIDKIYVRKVVKIPSFKSLVHLSKEVEFFTLWFSCLARHRAKI